MNVDFWNDRYRNKEFAYGTAPNVYLASVLPEHKPSGTMLFPADGEGRNGVFAATMGWDVHSFDQSVAGRDKALQLAATKGVSIRYDVADYESISLAANTYAALGLFYVHFSSAIKPRMHAVLIDSLQTGALVVLEAFSKEHELMQQINPTAGGPPDPDRFYSEEEILRDFADFEILELVQIKTELSEGLYHRGQSSVIRFTGKKK